MPNDWVDARHMVCSDSPAKWIFIKKSIKIGVNENHRMLLWNEIDFHFTKKGRAATFLAVKEEVCGESNS